MVPWGELSWRGPYYSSWVDRWYSGCDLQVQFWWSPGATSLAVFSWVRNAATTLNSSAHWFICTFATVKCYQIWEIIHEGIGHFPGGVEEAIDPHLKGFLCRPAIEGFWPASNFPCNGHFDGSQVTCWQRYSESSLAPCYLVTSWKYKYMSMRILCIKSHFVIKLHAVLAIAHILCTCGVALQTNLIQ